MSRFESDVVRRGAEKVPATVFLFHAIKYPLLHSTRTVEVSTFGTRLPTNEAIMSDPNASDNQKGRAVLNVFDNVAAAVRATSPNPFDGTGLRAFCEKYQDYDPDYPDYVPEVTALTELHGRTVDLDEIIPPASVVKAMFTAVRVNKPDCLELTEYINQTQATINFDVVTNEAA